MGEIVQLQAADSVVHVLEVGVLDHRAVAVFVGGQCHGLALALHEEKGWDLVAVDNVEGRCDHVCVQRPDGDLVDVTGVHTVDEMEAAAGAPIRHIGRSDIDDLERRHGWAPADVEGARSWVPGVLGRVQPLPALRGVTLRKSVVSHGLELCFTWDGHVFIEVAVRDASDTWLPYTRLACPRNQDGQHLVEFTPDRFEELVHVWMTHLFDPAQAAAQLE